MRLKQRIDQKFMDMYQQLPDSMAMPDDMPCRGCGCKLGGDALSAALRDDVERDDAALVTLPASGGNDTTAGSMLVTTDFFSSPFRDAWLTGRVAAIHAASDLYAMGASPFAAEAIVVLPDGDRETQRQMLSDFEAGADRDFERMGARITGGHTITGPRFEVGFTVLGQSTGPALIRKQGLVAGDRLFLTKPLGSGVLMAALMRGQCRRGDYETMIDAMLHGHQTAASIAVGCDVVCGTDVTGFGLLGHLQEMLTDDVQVQLNAEAIPVLPGTLEAVEQGIASTLLPSNRSYLDGVNCSNSTLQDLLLDPQTCGGLLLAVPMARADDFCEQFSVRGESLPAEIGVVEVATADGSRISVR